MELFVSQWTLFLLLVARITAMIVVAPVIGHQIVPVPMKVALGLFGSLVMFPLASANAGSVNVQFVDFLLKALREVAVGLLLGFSAGLVFAGIRFAGELVSFDMGFSLANVLDPETGFQTPVVGEFFVLFAMTVFLLLDGHHAVLQALQLSYQVVPVGAWSLNELYAQKLIAVVGMIFIVAVKFAAPIIVSLFLTNVALAILSRIMPQMNIFTVSFPLKIGIGLLVLTVATPVFFKVLKITLQQFESNVLDLLRSL